VKFAAIIPARLASSRFPRKVLHNFSNTPMVEHVRLRAEMSEVFDAGVYVATCDKEVYDLVAAGGGNPIITSKDHHSGTSRAIEAIKSIECSHVVIVQGDEPLIFPKQLKEFVRSIQENQHFDAWNGVSTIEDSQDMSDRSIVKCVVNESKEVVFCCRDNPFVSDFSEYKEFTNKLLGLIGFKKSVLENLGGVKQSAMEKSENIEQLQLICSRYKVQAINLGSGLPSVNLPEDALKAAKEMSTSQEQLLVLERYKNFTSK